MEEQEHYPRGVGVRFSKTILQFHLQKNEDKKPKWKDGMKTWRKSPTKLSRFMKYFRQLDREHFLKMRRIFTFMRIVKID